MGQSNTQRIFDKLTLRKSFFIQSILYYLLRNSIINILNSLRQLLMCIQTAYYPKRSYLVRCVYLKGIGDIVTVELVRHITKRDLSTWEVCCLRGEFTGFVLDYAIIFVLSCLAGIRYLDKAQCWHFLE